MRKKHHATHVHIWKKNHVTRKQIVLHISGKESFLHVWMSRVSLKNESYLTYGWVMSHVWMSHVTCLIFCIEMGHQKRSHITLNESRFAYEKVMSHLQWVMSHIWYLAFEGSIKKSVQQWPPKRWGVVFSHCLLQKKKKNQRPNDESVASHVLDLSERALIFPKGRPLTSKHKSECLNEKWVAATHRGSCSYAYRVAKSHRIP